jgi:phage tail sheath protein FI
MADYNTFTGWQYSNQFNSAPLTSSSVSTRGGIRDEIHLVVVDATGVWSGSAGTILEKYSYLSKASDGKNSDGSTNYYKDVINNSSKYIWVLDHPSTTANWGTTATSKTFDGLTANITSTLSGGVSGDSVSSANILAGYDLFSNDELYDVSLIPMGPTTSAGAVNTVIALAETRRDCVVFASPQYSDVVNTTGQADKIVTYRDTLTSSSFAVLDSGWKYQYDRYNDKYRYVPLNGDTAGLAARTDYVSDPWFSPAGYNRGIIKNVVKLAYSPSKADRDTLYKKGINPVVTFPGQGTLLFGDKTLLARPSAFDRINVRRLFIVLEKAIATASKFQLFEFNDPFTRAQFRNLVEPFLRDVQGRRGITDFRVVCDETNNTGEIIDRNEFIADIFIKPARAINFIQLNFIATRSGVSFEEVGA